jgi:hypothetical protein
MTGAKVPATWAWRPCSIIPGPGTLKAMKETVRNTGAGPAVAGNDDGHEGANARAANDRGAR